MYSADQLKNGTLSELIDYEMTDYNDTHAKVTFFKQLIMTFEDTKEWCKIGKPQPFRVQYVCTTSVKKIKLNTYH